MEYTKESLTKLNLSNLRHIAREIGVKSPTSKTKEILISDILDVLSGKVLPYHSNRGRKPNLVGDLKVERNMPLKKGMIYDEKTFKKDFDKLLLKFKKEIISLFNKHTGI